MKAKFFYISSVLTEEVTGRCQDVCTILKVRGGGPRGGRGDKKTQCSRSYADVLSSESSNLYNGWTMTSPVLGLPPCSNQPLQVLPNDSFLTKSLLLLDKLRSRFSAKSSGVQ